ncbi:hypothetical protein C8R46DRAFT_886253 [Mycena filopes]|nr:hypothetical protein C8R46DRAFT_886253 [Mycena filopes]
MSAYKSFAIVGAGAVGLPIATGLAAVQNVSVIILSRTSTKTPPPGVQLVQVDTSDAAAVTAVLKQHKVDVVVSTISASSVAGTVAQKPVVDAAKAAGVKLFVPSEFALPTDGKTSTGADDFLAAKNDLAGELNAAGLPTARFFTGLFIDYIAVLKGDGDVKVIGKGDTPLSLTSVADTTGFVTHVLTTLPASQLENRIFRLEGDRVTLREIAALFGTGVEYVEAEVAAAATDDWTRFIMYFLTMYESGAGSTGWDWHNGQEGKGEWGAGSANALWAGHHWQTIKELYKL